MNLCGRPACGACMYPPHPGSLQKARTGTGEANTWFHPLGSEGSPKRVMQKRGQRSAAYRSETTWVLGPGPGLEGMTVGERPPRD